MKLNNLHPNPLYPFRLQVSQPTSQTVAPPTHLKMPFKQPFFGQVPANNLTGQSGSQGAAPARKLVYVPKIWRFVFDLKGVCQTNRCSPNIVSHRDAEAWNHTPLLATSIGAQYLKKRMAPLLYCFVKLSLIFFNKFVKLQFCVYSYWIVYWKYIFEINSFQKLTYIFWSAISILEYSAWQINGSR